MPVKICLKIPEATASKIKFNGESSQGFTTIVTKILDDFKHFFTVSKLHNCKDLLGNVVNEELIDLDNIFMTQFMMIFEFIHNLFWD